MGGALPRLASPATLLLLGLAWAVGARGGSRPLDLAVLSVLAVLALVAAGVRAGELPGLVRSPGVVAALALAVWTALAATTGGGGAAWVYPGLVLTLVVTWWAADRMGEGERLLLVHGLAVVGVFVAATAVVGWAAAVASGSGLGVRAPTVLGYQNGAAALMLAAVGAALHLHHRGCLDLRWVAVACGLSGLGVLATGSRSALLVGLAGLTWWVWRRRSARAALAGAVVAAPVLLVLVHRFATSSNERLVLWASAWRAMVSGPVTGRGPVPVALAGAPGARPTTHAHNELLQVGLEYGVPGLVLAGVCLAAVAFGLARRTALDPALVVGCAALALLGMTDFALRFPAVSVALVLLAAATWRPVWRAGRRRAAEPSTTGVDRRGARRVDPIGAAPV